MDCAKGFVEVSVGMEINMYACATRSSKFKNCAGPDDSDCLSLVLTLLCFKKIVVIQRQRWTPVSFIGRDA